MDPRADRVSSPPSGYGDTFADVYDHWYGGLPEGPTAVASLAAAADRGPVLELGIGTGRLALPLVEALAGAGTLVTGIDNSTAMLSLLRDKAGGRSVPVVRADMTALPLAGPSARFSLVFAAWNTWFNLTSVDAQRAAFAEVARVLKPDGRLLIEVYVPTPWSGLAAVGYSGATSTRRVLTVGRTDPTSGVVSGSHLELVEDGVKVRAWRLLPLTPDKLDAIASDAGLQLVERWGGWSGRPFVGYGTHVSHYGRAP